MYERRPTAKPDWRVREAVGIRPPRKIACTVHAEILRSLEEQLSRLFFSLEQAVAKYETLMALRDPIKQTAQ